MKSKPIPGSSGDVLRELPSPYLPHGPTGLLHLPRFIAKIEYTARHGQLPASYRKNYKRGLDRFLCLHLGVEPDAVEAVVNTSETVMERDRRLLELFPDDLRAHIWNRELVHKGMTAAGREFLADALREMGCADRSEDIVSVCDLIDFDEGRIE